MQQSDPKKTRSGYYPHHSPDSPECRLFMGRWEATWATRWELWDGKYYPKAKS
jgi:hypothetical protein